MASIVPTLFILAVGKLFSAAPQSELGVEDARLGDQTSDKGIKNISFIFPFK